ncbi:hypothetical protein FHG87_021482 [Trinorchestia longiramus]|nr:hypothetical protein FHG87_021482 [Trinorchestia longiramus]
MTQQQPSRHSSNPHDTASNPHDTASNPHDSASNPHDIASNPHDTASNPHDTAANGQWSPTKIQKMLQKRKQGTAKNARQRVACNSCNMEECRFCYSNHKSAAIIENQSRKIQQLSRQLELGRQLEFSR